MSFARHPIAVSWSHSQSPSGFDSLRSTSNAAWSLGGSMRPRGSVLLSYRAYSIGATRWLLWVRRRWFAGTGQRGDYSGGWSLGWPATHSPWVASTDSSDGKWESLLGRGTHPSAGTL